MVRSHSFLRHFLFCLCAAAILPQAFADDGGSILDSKKPAASLGNSIFEIDSMQFYLPEYQTSASQMEMVRTGDFYEGDMLEKLNEILPASPVIIDVGAGIGVRSCYWAAKSNAIRVIAFEPMVRNCDAFKRNVRLNRLQRVVILNCFAVSDDDEMLSVHYVDGGDLTRTKLKSGGEDGIIDAKRLDSVKLDVNRIDLLSVSVNGFEGQVLAGAQKTLERLRPSYILLGTYANSDDMSEAEHLLYQLGYEREMEFEHGIVLYRNVLKNDGAGDLSDGDE
ncbi:MAG: FkbM family methyltransferase [Puniceicoccales bacterium]|jgi:FkbM family methyltransferase|nr:FkbM family methyltransferase [Puniceicoccales bacterium]